MGETPHRSPLRYSLQTLMVLISIVCCWLGWETSHVRQRRALLDELKANQAFQFFPADDYVARYPQGSPPVPPAKVSFLRRLLGDRAIQQIHYTPHYAGYSEAELHRLQAAFPEAQASEMLAEPCHPGCFPAGTLVDTPTGPRAIEGFVRGDRVLAILPDGSAESAAIQEIVTTSNRLWQIESSAGSLLTTETQPLCVNTGETVCAGSLRPGDTVLKRCGELTCEAQVLSVSATGRYEPVFNLILGDSQRFVASGFLARSKPPAKVSPQ